MATIYPYYAHSGVIFCEDMDMELEFSGIERRLDELNERLARLEPLIVSDWLGRRSG